MEYQIYSGTPITKVYTEDTYTLDYMTIMKDLNLWSSSVSPTPEETKRNEVIANTTSFNIVVYAYVTARNAGFTQEYKINDAYYENLEVNELSMKREIVPYSSLAMYDTNAISIKVDVESLPSDYAYETETTDDVVYNKVKFYLYFTVSLTELDSNGEYVTTYYPIYYEFIYKFPKKEDEEDEEDEEDDDNNEENPDTPTPPDPNPDSEVPLDPTEGFDTHIDVTHVQILPEYTNYVYLNSISLKEWMTYPLLQPSSILSHNDVSNTNILSTSDSVLRLHFNEKCSSNLDITIYATDAYGKNHTKTYKYSPAKASSYENKYERAPKMNAPNVSYGLLRVNPKLTGNIKVVVDEKSNIYLDTFKVSKSLEQKRFRHVKVNANEYYGQTLMAKYRDIPTTDFYKVEDKCYNLFTTAQTYDSQYYDLYNYGVKTNNDNMYSENFALLAPLCIKEVVPDFFLIFKVDTTAKNYDESWSDKRKIKYFLKNGKIVKSYDMRKGSVLGEYIRTIYEKSKEYPGDAYLSYSATNHNRYIGISVDRGVVASAYESPFKEEGIQSQVAMNEFYTEGFERNHLVSKNIINFEYMFNDTDAELFSIDTYFGLYVKLNAENEDFSCIGEEIIETTDDFGNTDTKTKYVFDTSIHTFGENTTLSSSAYQNSIYGLSTAKEFIRLDKGLYNAPEIKDYVLKPYKNVLSGSVKKLPVVFKSFMMFKLNNLLEIGDHIRIADIKAKTIYEIVTTNTFDYHDENSLSDVTTTYLRINSSIYTIKYISMYISSRKHNMDAIGNTPEGENPTLEMILESQAEQLFNAFKKFNVPEIFSSYKIEGTRISLFGNVPNLVFERICSPSGFTEEQKIYLEEDDTENNTIEFFNNIYPDKLILDVENKTWMYSKFVYLYPLHFEVVGNRMAHACAFIQLSSFNDDNLYAIKIPSDDIFDYKTLVYSTKNNGEISNVKYNDIDIVSFTESDGIISQSSISTKYIPSYADEDEVILNVSHPYLINNTFNMYNSYPLNAGICSIFNIKDFEFSVLDADSHISLLNETTKIGDKGEFAKATIFNSGQVEAEDEIDYEPVTENGFTTYYSIDGYDINIYEGVMYKLRTVKNKIYYRLENPTNNFTYDIAGNVIHLPKIPNTNLIDYGPSTVSYVFKYQIDNSYNAVSLLNCFIKMPEDDETAPEYPESYDLTSTISYYRTDEENIIDATIQEFIYFWNGGEGSKLDKDRTASGAIRNMNIISFIYYIGGWVASGILSSLPTYESKTGYSNTPIRSTSEENIKDYIDKYRSFYYDENNKDINISDVSNVSRYFSNLFENNHTKSDMSLVSPYVCKWKGIGTDARGENLRVMHDFKRVNKETGEAISILNDASSYFVSGSDTYSTYLGYLYSKDGGNYNKYISNSINDLATRKSPDSSIIGLSEKEYILEDNGTLEDLLYTNSNFNNKFSVAYNAGEDTLEFISAGVKFRIKTNNNDAINLSNYNGYSAVFISLPDVNKDYARETELIIDELRKEIMLIWYQNTNTLTFGKSYSSIPNNYDLFDMILPNRYLCRFYHEDDIKNALCSFRGTDRTLEITDDAGFGNMVGYTAQNENEEDLRGIQLCKRYGAVWLGSVVTDPTKYTKYNRIALTGTLHPTHPEREYPFDYTYSYYIKDGYLTLIDPYFWHNYDATAASNSDIDNYSYDYSPSVESFLATDDLSCIPSKPRNFNDLKKAVSSCAIYIKTDEGKKDYTMYNNLLNISIIEPIIYYKHEGLGKAGTRADKKKEIELGYVHPSYVEPVMVDMFKFNYASSDGIEIEESDETETSESTSVKSLESIFEKSFDGANIMLDDVNKLKQLWFNKYTEEFNYCIKKTIKEDETIYRTKTSIDFRNDISLMLNSWNNLLYRNYYVLTDEETKQDVEYYDYVPGYKTGYELKTYIHGRGINLNGSNGRTVEITSWKNTEISQKNKYIKLDITDSLVYNILFRDAFNKYWNYLNLTDNTYKINYIKNTILPLININNKTKFVLYKNDKILKSLKFNSELNENECSEIINYKNELKYENGKYYMYVYPEEISSYYAKMIIDL